MDDAAFIGELSNERSRGRGHVELRAVAVLARAEGEPSSIWGEGGGDRRPLREAREGQRHALRIGANVNVGNSRQEGDIRDLSTIGGPGWKERC